MTYRAETWALTNKMEMKIAAAQHITYMKINILSTLIISYMVKKKWIAEQTRVIKLKVEVDRTHQQENRLQIDPTNNIMETFEWIQEQRQAT